MRTLTKEMLNSLNPEHAIKLLLDGNKRFTQNLKINRNLLQQVNETRDGQHPFAVIISCMDSRTSAELIFDQGLGDIFSIRIAGNVINDDIIGSAEFGCKVIGAKAIVVLGHTHCGAITGALTNVELGNLTCLLNKIQVNIPNNDEFRQFNTKEQTAWLTQANVRHSMYELKTRSSILTDMEAHKQIKIVGAMYDVESGEVFLLE